MAEHREMEQAWDGFRDSLELIAHGERVLLRELEVDRFCKLYRTHIALEEANLIPLAGKILGKEDLAAIGKAMAARRGVKWP
jgi:hemerythrin-like domain-containing protein